MSCNCDKAKNIPSCIDTLVIGDVADGSASYYVYFKTPDGRIDRYTAEDIVYTDLLGVSNPEVRVGVMYEIWVAKVTANNANERTAFTPYGSTDSVTCVNVIFDYCNNEFTQQIITLE